MPDRDKEMDFTDESSPFTPQPDAFSPSSQHQEYQHEYQHHEYQQKQNTPKDYSKKEQKSKNSGNSEKIYTPGPMSPLEAVNHMRNLRDPSSDGYLFTPSKF
jgi:hypothetical protein